MQNSQRDVYLEPSWIEVWCKLVMCDLLDVDVEFMLSFINLSWNYEILNFIQTYSSKVMILNSLIDRLQNWTEGF